MTTLTLLDVAPDPVSIGIVIAVVLFVVVVVAFVLALVVLWLWYRKRSLRHQEMIRPENASLVDSVSTQ